MDATIAAGRAKAPYRPEAMVRSGPTLAALTGKRVTRPKGGTVLTARVQRSDEVDPEVVAAAVRGDAEAFVAIMRHYDLFGRASSPFTSSEVAS